MLKSSLAIVDLDKHKDVLAHNLDVLCSIKGYVHGLSTTNLNTITEPPPSWFDTLSTNLGNAKVHADVWDKTLEPSITSQIPQTVINLGSRFTTAADKMLNILAASNYHPNADQIKELQDEIKWITRHMSEEMQTIAVLKNTFTTFQVNANTDFNALCKDNNNIQQALLDDTNKANDLDGDIKIYQAEITADKAKIDIAAITGGVGLFVGVGIMGLGAAVTGPAAPFVIGIGALICVGSIIEMAAVIAVYSKKIADLQDKVNQETFEYNNEIQQINALTLLNASVNNILTLSDDMSQSLNDIADWWVIIVTQINTVSNDINDAAKDMTESDWKDFTLDIQQAKKDWSNFADFATQWQKTATTIVMKLVPRQTAPEIPKATIAA